MSTITALTGSTGITTADAMTKINTNFSNLNTDKIETSYLDTDTTLAANSDAKIPSQKAVKAYIDAGGDANRAAALAGLSGTTPSATNKFVDAVALRGQMVAYAGDSSSAVPTGYLVCDGSAVSRSTYAGLFSTIGTTYGVGDNSTTFNLPVARSASYNGFLIHDCDTNWASGLTVTVLETSTIKVGTGSVKYTTNGGEAAGERIMTGDITAVNLSSYTTVGMWLRSSVSLNAGDLIFLLDNTSQCASPLETINAPALTANTWKWCSFTLAAAASDTAIISFGFKQNIDIGVFTLYVDDIVATRGVTSVPNLMLIKT